ncbi:hypothetical protein ASZ90_003989 [hydrocarbon metagenome]|uniref:DUF3800 domain-containing protein n=1 Tax=hydrocarbon metagenome TaxID=938273 RepID=A0A0W8FZH2_9ZZZZ
MKPLINIYCDESCHLENDNYKVMVLGAIWLPEEKKEEIFNRLKEIKLKHGFTSTFEIKWNKVSKQKADFYFELINYFFDDDDLHFRTLVVPDKSILDHSSYNQTHDDFYYKMYFDLLKIILSPDYAYNIYLDIKDTQSQKKVEKLQDVLCSSHYDFEKKILRKIQQVRSHEVSALQLCDLFTGAVSYLHRGLTSSETKLMLIERIKERSGYSLLQNTLPKEDKMNVFVWRSKNG